MTRDPLAPLRALARTDPPAAWRASRIWVQNDCCVAECIREIVRWHNVEAAINKIEER